jgi:hypothetical protein
MAESVRSLALKDKPDQFAHKIPKSAQRLRSLPPSPMLSPPQPSLPPGHRNLPGDLVADKYRLVRPLGKGGMGVVWVAHNSILDVHVAIKIIDIRHVARPKVVSARVLQEARTAARLGHAAVCRVFEFGETQHGDPFVVTELLHGETLADVLKRQSRMPAVQAVAWLLPIAEGLVMAHEKGIVHRDVKPENIFLSHDDVHKIRPKLLDFGIARFLETDNKLTQDGALLGTPHYMSPEQARGEAELDARSDVWSLSVVLYELITGQLPFDGDNYNALLWSIGHDEPRSITDWAGGDPRLAAILERGLKKRPGERWQTMRTLGEHLAAWLHGQGMREDVCGGSLRATWLEGSPLDPGPDAPIIDLEMHTLRPGPGAATPDVQVILVGAPGAGRSMEARTGVFERPLPAQAPRPARRWPWFLAVGAVLLVGIALTLSLTIRSRTRPAAPTASGEIEPRHAGRPDRSDLALPMVMATEVSSGVVPSAEPSADPASKRAPAANRSRPPRKIVPERYDLGF